jgi:hypothetical protein
MRIAAGTTPWPARIRLLNRIGGMDAWMSQRARSLASAAGLEPSALELNDAEVDDLLDLARIAAHESDARTNAPLLCYLVGVAAATGGKSVGELAEAVRSSGS